MNLTIRQLRAFVTVAELESFRLAAQRLNLTPGAVSLLIRDLEAQCEFSVFDRTTRRVSLSRAGRDFLPAAQTVLREMQSVVIAANDVRLGTDGVIRVAAPLVIASSLLPQAMAVYRAEHPKVMIRPVDCPNEMLVQCIETDQADIAIGPDRPAVDEVQRVAIFESPWVLWCSTTHPLARRRKITWKDLERESVIAAGQDYETRVAQAFEDQTGGEPFTPTYVVDNITTAFGIAAQGLGVTLAPSYVGVLAGAMGLVMKRVQQPEIVRELCLYHARKRRLSEPVESFLAFLRVNLTQAGAKQLRQS
ncbi:MAG: LysR family transcriptional regulator [Burkholderiaceae bacterium]